MRDENIFTYFEGQGVKIDHHSASRLKLCSHSQNPKP